MIANEVTTSEDAGPSAPPPVQTITPPAAVPPKAKPSSGDVTRTTIVVRGRDYLEHIFYRGGEETARIKEFNDGTFESSGEIPDGKVKFKDEYAGTYGEEFYQDGRRQGLTQTYFSDGRLKSSSEYLYGRLIRKKEYYPGGLLRFEVDYSDARDYDDDEVGIGKLYFPNGALKYEWSLINRESRGFKKSYNQDGTLRAVTYFDGKGDR
jgi:antitoxin component YwqK of YwqJK toxin-antitoxin module